jgi:hypothetical protein
MTFFTCTVNQIGPTADGPETANSAIYINLTDAGGSFINQGFYAAEGSKAQMLSVGLAAISTNKQVYVAIDNPNVPYSSVTRMILLGPAATGGTKTVLDTSFDNMPTSGQNFGPLDISAFAKIRFSVIMNGEGSIQFYLYSSSGSQSFYGWQLDNFTVAIGDERLTRTYDVAGTALFIQMIPSNSINQAIIGIFGNWSTATTQINTTSNLKKACQVTYLPLPVPLAAFLERQAAFVSDTALT